MHCVSLADTALQEVIFDAVWQFYILLSTGSDDGLGGSDYWGGAGGYLNLVITKGDNILRRVIVVETLRGCL